MPATLVTLPVPPLLAITDRAQAKCPLPELARLLCEGGCRWISLREKDLDPEARLELLEELLLATRDHRAIVTVHGDLDAAAECDGVHLPAGGDVEAARRRLGRRALIGLSCHTGDEVRRAAAAGADYVTLSPIFLTDSKPGYGPALGVAALEAVRHAGIAVLALGGVEPDTVSPCRRAGAAGVAVMGRLMRTARPAELARALIANL